MTNVAWQLHSNKEAWVTLSMSLRNASEWLPSPYLCFFHLTLQDDSSVAVSIASGDACPPCYCSAAPQGLWFSVFSSGIHPRSLLIGFFVDVHSWVPYGFYSVPFIYMYSSQIFFRHCCYHHSMKIYRHWPCMWCSEIRQGLPLMRII